MTLLNELQSNLKLWKNNNDGNMTVLFVSTSAKPTTCLQCFDFSFEFLKFPQKTGGWKQKLLKTEILCQMTF